MGKHAYPMVGVRLNCGTPFPSNKWKFSTDNLSIEIGRGCFSVVCITFETLRLLTRLIDFKESAKSFVAQINILVAGELIYDKNNLPLV